MSRVEEVAQLHWSAAAGRCLVGWLAQHLAKVAGLGPITMVLVGIVYLMGLSGRAAGWLPRSIDVIAVGGSEPHAGRQCTVTGLAWL